MVAGQVYQYRRDILVQERQAKERVQRGGTAAAKYTAATTTHDENVEVWVEAPGTAAALVHRGDNLPPPQRQSASPSAVLTDVEEHKRRQCIQAALENSMGWKERGPHFYFRGCNFKTVIDIDEWAKETQCGISPQEGKL